MFHLQVSCYFPVSSSGNMLSWKIEYKRNLRKGPFYNIATGKAEEKLWSHDRHG